MEFFLNVGFVKGQPISKNRLLTIEPLRGDILVGPCQPNPSSSILRFSRLAEFFVPRDDGQKDVIQLYDPVIVHANSKYMEVHGYERGEDGFYMQSWILRPIMIDPTRSHAAHFHSGQPGHPGYEAGGVKVSESPIAPGK